MNVEVKQANSLKAPKTVYHFKDISNEVKVVGNVDFDKVGAYEVEYEVPTITGKYTVSQTVNVVDTYIIKETIPPTNGIKLQIFIVILKIPNIIFEIKFVANSLVVKTSPGK